jgi:hypothetical protein
MEISSFEALLQAMCFLFPGDVKKTATYRNKKFKRQRNKAIEFSLYELITIANEASWFPSERVLWGKRMTVAGFVHEARKLRNFVHPGVWGREHPATTKFSKKGL